MTPGFTGAVIGSTLPIKLTNERAHPGLRMIKKKKFTVTTITLSLSAGCVIAAAIHRSSAAAAHPLDAGHTRYSPLAEINVSNVKDLRPVWVYDTGAKGRGWEESPI